MVSRHFAKVCVEQTKRKDRDHHSKKIIVINRCRNESLLFQQAKNNLCKRTPRRQLRMENCQRGTKPFRTIDEQK